MLVSMYTFCFSQAPIFFRSCGIGYSLIYDFCVHLRYYATNLKSDKDAAAATPMFEEYRPVIDKLINCYINDSENARLFNLSLNPDLTKNYHTDVEDTLQSGSDDSILKSNARALLLSQGKDSWHHRPSVPLVGVLAQNPLEDGTSYVSTAAMYLSSVGSYWTNTSLPLPATLKAYVKQVAYEFLVVLDKFDITVS